MKKILFLFALLANSSFAQTNDARLILSDAPSLLIKYFEQLDTNKNLSLDEQELSRDNSTAKKAFVKYQQEFDNNQNGSIELQELKNKQLEYQNKAQTKFWKQWYKQDKNKDLYITKKEASFTVWIFFGQADKNNDNLLDPKELSSFVSHYIEALAKKELNLQ